MLQPGTVINAQVLKILADNLVRIAIASLSIDVLSEVPLQAGQTLQLAVSQTPDGIRLAVVGQGAGAMPAASPPIPSRWRRRILDRGLCTGGRLARESIRDSRSRRNHA